MNRFEQIYNLPEHPGQPREFLQMREITASSDGVDKWRQSFRWWGKNIQELPEVTLFGPGTLSVTNDRPFPRAPDPGRIYVMEVRFPEPLQSGQRVRFALTKRHPVRFEEVVREGWRDFTGLVSLTVPTETAILGVRFPRDERPRSVWHFEDLPDWLLPGVGTEENRIVVDQAGFATFTWESLFVGYSYGLAWEW